MPTIRTDQGLHFHQRPRRMETESGRRRIWSSRCGRYRVSEFTRLGEDVRRYYAERSYVDFRGVTCWDVISSHRRRQPALNACVRHFTNPQQPRSSHAGQ